MSHPSPPPAGWYPDPSGAPGQRYFDGSNWTGARQQAPTGAGGTFKKFAIVTGGTAAGILLVIFIIVAFLAHACGAAARDLNKDSSADAPTVHLGENFNVGGLAVSNMKARLQSDLGSDGFMDKTAKGIYVVITAHVTNNGTKAHGLDSMSQKLLVGQKEYQADSFADVGSSTPMKTSVYLEPGFSDDVTFVFDVPRSSVIEGTTASFTEKTVLEVSSGLDFDAPKPKDVKVLLGG